MQIVITARRLVRTGAIVASLFGCLVGPLAAQATPPSDFETQTLAPREGDASVTPAGDAQAKPAEAPAPSTDQATTAAPSGNPLEGLSAEAYSKHVERVKSIRNIFGKLRDVVAANEQTQQMVATAPVMEDLPPEAMEVDDDPALGSESSVLDEAPAKGKSRKSKAGKSHGGTYKVQKGDTLGKIARKLLGSTKKASAIAKANGMGTGESLTVGRELVIPGSSNISEASLGDVEVGGTAPDVKAKGKAVKKSAKGKTARGPKNPGSEPVLDYSNYDFQMYVVKPGDNIAKVSKAFYGNSSGAELIKKYNKLAGEKANLKAGEKILIPVPKQKASDERYEKAKKGIF